MSVTEADRLRAQELIGPFFDGSRGYLLHPVDIAEVVAMELASERERAQAPTVATSLPETAQNPTAGNPVTPSTDNDRPEATEGIR